MNKVYKKQEFIDGSPLKDDAGRICIDQTVFDHCFMDFSTKHKYWELNLVPENRPTITNSSFLKCSFTHSCTFDDYVIENCVFDGFVHKRGLCFWHGPVFKETVIKGKIGRLSIKNYWNGPEDANSEQLAKGAENDNYYSSRRMKFALDISLAEANDFEVMDVPSHLIIRDKETQVLLSLDRLLDFDTKGLEGDLKLSLEIDIRRARFHSTRTKLIIAPKLRKKGTWNFTEVMGYIDFLRKNQLLVDD